MHLNIHAHAVDVLVKNVYFQSPNFRSVACLMYDLNCSVAKRWNKLTLERHTTFEHPYSFYTDNFVFYYWSISLFHGRPFHGLLFIYCKMVYNILCEILLWWYFYVRYSSYLLGSVIERQRDRMGYWHKRQVSSSSPPSLPPKLIWIIILNRHKGTYRLINPRLPARLCCIWRSMIPNRSILDLKRKKCLSLMLKTDKYFLNPRYLFQASEHSIIGG